MTQVGRLVSRQASSSPQHGQMDAFRTVGPRQLDHEQKDDDQEVKSH
jgi:hypothetical protein